MSILGASDRYREVALLHSFNKQLLFVDSLQGSGAGG